MAHATDKKSYAAPPGTIAARLMANRQRIISEWLTRMRKASRFAEREEDPIIVDTLPALLENLAQTLDRQYPRDVATEGTTIASEHGGERARVTDFPPSVVIREYQVLRDVLLEILSETNPLGRNETAIIVKSIDLAMTQSLTAYFLVHQALHEQFVAILTHDLRNPLQAIQTANELIARNPTLSEQLPIWSSKIAASLRRVDRMIQDLLDASRVQFGERIHFEVEEFDLYSMLQESVSQFSAVHGNRFNLNGKSLCGFWNRTAFRRAVDNLLENAVKYGDPVRPIAVRLEEIRGRAIVSVQNYGSYIPAEEQENLFKAFMRTQSAHTKKKRGWGLGLVMVRGMAEGHGGSVTVDSSPERGTAFVIDVPVDARSHMRHHAARRSTGSS